MLSEVVIFKQRSCNGKGVEPELTWATGSSGREQREMNQEW